MTQKIGHRGPEGQQTIIDVDAEIISTQTEATKEPLENSTQEQIKDDPFAKGRERIAAVGNFIKSSKEKLGSVAQNIGGKISRFWTRTKSVGAESARAVFSAGKESAAALLSADVLAKKGVDYVGGAINNKVEQVKGFVQGKIELAQDVALYAKEKTSETFNKVKTGIDTRYQSLKGYGERAVEKAKAEYNKQKNDYRNKVNEIRRQRLLKQLTEQHQQTSASETAFAAATEGFTKKRKELEELIALFNTQGTTA